MVYFFHNYLHMLTKLISQLTGLGISKYLKKLVIQRIVQDTRKMVPIC